MASPDTIVLVHGIWVTPRSWEDRIAHYEARGFRVLAPGYPGFEVEVEALNADPGPIARLKVPAIIGHLESVLDGLDAPPVIIGHSAGVAFTQILLDHGYGAATVSPRVVHLPAPLDAPRRQLDEYFADRRRRDAHRGGRVPGGPTC